MAAAGVAEGDAWIFGYGSLMCADSRSRSGQTGLAVPVNVAGIQRRWGAQVNLPASMVVHPGLTSISAVSVEEEPGSRCNGVIVKVLQSEIPAFDEREAGYTRTPLDPARITAFAPDQAEAMPHLSASTPVYVYVSNTPGGQPSDTYPIFQSYVDVMVRGCLEISPSFCTTFLETTQHWQPADPASKAAYLDDRHAPGYLRFDPVASSPANGARTDELVKQARPTDFATRVKGPGPAPPE